MFTTTFLVIDRSEPGQKIAHEVYVNYRAKAERGPGLDGMVDVKDIEIDSILETTVWFGKIKGGRVSLSQDVDGYFEKSVLAELRSQLADQNSELYQDIAEKCAQAYREELSYAD